MIPPPPRSSLFPYTTLFRSSTAFGGSCATFDKLQRQRPVQPHSPLRCVHRFRNGEWGWTGLWRDRKSTRLNSSHSQISYAVFCLKKKKKKKSITCASKCERS